MRCDDRKMWVMKHLLSGTEHVSLRSSQVGHSGEDESMSWQGNGNNTAGSCSLDSDGMFRCETRPGPLMLSLLAVAEVLNQVDWMLVVACSRPDTPRRDSQDTVGRGRMTS